MELELNLNHLNCFHTILDKIHFHEETMETIVPDACPDIAKVINTQGRLSINTNEVSEGKVEVTGTVIAMVLYQPEDGVGVENMEVAIPFHCRLEASALHTGCKLLLVPRIQNCDSRMLNPRKLLVRLNLAMGITAYTPDTISLCTDVICDSSSGIEQKIHNENTYIAVCVEEKTFTYNDEFSLPASKSEATTLLRYWADFMCTDSKIIGTKLIFKGIATVKTMYRTVANQITTANFEIPFSQIMEVNGATEDGRCTVEIFPMELNCALSEEGDGRNFTITMGLMAQACVEEMVPVTVLADVYSTVYELKPEFTQYQFNHLVEQNSVEQAVRELVETPSAVESVVACYANVGQITQQRDGERLNLTASVYLTLVYWSEDGSLCDISKSVEVVCPLNVSGDTLCHVRCTLAQDISATPSLGGIEVRSGVGFHYKTEVSTVVAGVSSLDRDGCALRDTANQPSVVLCCVQQSQNLWDMAKRYATTPQDIMRVNQMSEEILSEGQMVLIPKKR